MGRIIARAAVAAAAEQYRRAGKSIVLTNGCFDLLHVGHLRCLRAVKQQGDILMVGVNDDAAVRLLKGRDRPFIPAAERLEMVAGLEPVDLAFIFAERTASVLLEEIKPDVYAKGGDYEPANLPEAEAAASCGARLFFFPYQPGYSTTALAALASARQGGRHAEG